MNVFYLLPIKNFVLKMDLRDISAAWSRIQGRISAAEAANDEVGLLSQLTALGTLLEASVASGVETLNVGGKTIDIQKESIRLQKRLQIAKDDVRSRYVSEDDTDSLCKSFSPIIFEQGRKECRDWFDSVIGLERPKKELQDGLINTLKYPKLYGDPTKGILLYGPPGTGKTNIVRASINELSSSGNIRILFYAPSASQLKGKYFGESEKMITSMFTCASKEACSLSKQLNSDASKESTDVLSVIFLDEFDSIAGNRSDDKFAATTVNALLQVMDGIVSYPNVAMIAATNYPWNLDPAVLRRFTTSILVDLPSKEDIYDQMMALLTTHFDGLKKVTDTRSLQRFCESLGKTGTSKVIGEPCKRPEKRAEFWKLPPYSNLIRNLDEPRLRALAEICEKEMYSGSDIARLFKSVIQQTASQAVENNTFMRYTFPLKSGQRYGTFLSTLSLGPDDLLKAFQKNRMDFRFLSSPDILLVKFANKEFLNKSVYPILNLNDPNIHDVFLELFEGQTFPQKMVVMTSFITEIHQQDKSALPEIPPELYAGMQTKPSLQKQQRILYKFVEQHLLSKGYDMSILQDTPWQDLLVLVNDPRVMESVTLLTVPGMKRVEQFFVATEIDLSPSTVRRILDFSKNAWSKVTGSDYDPRKSAQEKREEFSNLVKLLSSGRSSLLTTWGSSTGAAFEYPVSEPSLLFEFLLRRSVNVPFSVFGVDMGQVFSWLAGSQPEAIGVTGAEAVMPLGKKREIPFVRVTSNPVSVTKLLERTLPCEAAETFWNTLDAEDKRKLSEWFDTPGTLGTDDQVLKELDIVGSTGQKSCLGDLKLLYSKYSAASQRALQASVVNFNVTNGHFELAKKLVKSSVDKSSVENLRRYAESPSTFVLEKKQ
ncbi:AAA-family ATPase [Brazilian marseillevirus]|uniref:AAA-family ATPase n=1 Tax=Brazilian marseillevirus TaxID=1813599 RepID=UPI000784CBD3|nr:AAA-family ATPase [Brazilian marseillevirus]AMQ10962.1 AAA-family ATPase [Brazilian marseillevirus]